MMLSCGGGVRLMLGHIRSLAHSLPGEGDEFFDSFVAFLT